MTNYFNNQKGVAHIIVIIILILGLGLGLYLVTQKTNLFSRASVSSPVSGPVTAYPVAGTVFVDINGNRQRESEDYGYSGANLVLSQDGNEIQSVFTNGSGNFAFSAKPIGRYRITLRIPSGYNRVSDDSFEFELDSAKTFNFAISPKSTTTPIGSYKITGNVFIDSNSNGTFDSGESLYTGARVRITKDGFSDSSGAYEIVIGPSRYRISVEVPQGYQRTTDDSFEFELNGDKAFNFGIKPR